MSGVVQRGGMNSTTRQHGRETCTPSERGREGRRERRKEGGREGGRVPTGCRAIIAETSPLASASTSLPMATLKLVM